MSKGWEGDAAPEARAGTRVVVTGIGLVTSLGANREATWSALRLGTSGARVLERDEDGGPPHVGFPAPLWFGDAEEPVLGLLEVATRQAIADASLPTEAERPERRGCLIGLSKGGVRSLGRVHQLVTDNAPAELQRRWLGMCWPNVGATAVARWSGARGPCLAPVAACATGLVAVLQGAELIRRGTCDAVLAGASDASLEPVLLAAFRRMKALARFEPGNDPSAAVRPLDRGRSGFLVGEGAAVLVLERADHAEARGARPYAEVVGGALGSDAYHLTDLNPDPANLAGLIGRALMLSGVVPSEVDHINLHGTATRSNDPLECRAIRAALGSRADVVSCTANKAQVGHLLGAAGAVELAITCLAIRDGFVPPTLNLNDLDPDCDLDATPRVGRARSIRVALKLSLGFGGHLAVAVLRAPGPSRFPTVSRGVGST